MPAAFARTVAPTRALNLWPRGGPAWVRFEPLRFRRLPLLAAALCFASGDALAPLTAPLGVHQRPTILFLAATILLVSLTTLAQRRSPRLTLLPLLALWIAAGLWCASLEPAPPSQLALEQYADGLNRTVEGRIARIRELSPQTTQTENKTSPEDETTGEASEAASLLSFDLAVTAIEDVTPDTSTMVPLSGGVRVILTGDVIPPALHCGDRIRVPLRLRIPDRYRDPGAWQYADYLATQGVGAHASVPVSWLTRSGALAPATPSWPTPASLRCTLYTVQSWAARRFAGFAASPANHVLPRPLRLTPEDAGILDAMLFGDRDRLNHDLRLGFERTGSFHLFVVSGMHVGLLAGALFWFGRRLHLGRTAATLLSIGGTTLYALLTGFGIPVQRALLMASVFLLARLLSRDRNVLNALGAALLGVLILSPRSLFDAGFQMTFLAILAIAGIALPLGDWTFLPYARAATRIDDLWNDARLPPPLAQFRVLLRLWGEHLAALLGPRAHALPAAAVRGLLWTLELVLIGTVAELVMVLPMAVYFHRATLFALPANMLTVPLVALLTPIAVLTFLLTLVSPWLALLPATAAAFLLHGITFAITHVSDLRGADWRIPAPPALAMVVALLSWAFCCWTVRRNIRTGRRWAFSAAVLLPLVTLLVLWPQPPLLTAGELEVTALDVGQGDSLFLASPTGQTMLVDAGGPVGGVGGPTSLAASSKVSAFEIGEDVVSPYLWSRRLRHLDVVALTHAHSDHMGGMPAILRNFRPRELWVGIDPASPAYQSLLQQAKTLGIAVRHLHAGERLAWGGTDLQVLAPALGYTNPGSPANNDSLVLRLDFGRASVLLEGDAEAPSEQAMLSTGELRPVTLLKVGHHGSRTSTTPGFFAAVTPQDAVISVGRHNTFGHPRREVVTRIAEAHTHLFRTDEFGLSQFLLTHDGAIRESGAQPSP